MVIRSLGQYPGRQFVEGQYRYCCCIRTYLSIRYWIICTGINGRVFYDDVSYPGCIHIKLAGRLPLPGEQSGRLPPTFVSAQELVEYHNTTHGIRQPTYMVPETKRATSRYTIGVRMYRSHCCCLFLVTTELLSQDEEKTRTRGVLIMSTGRKNGSF